MAKKKGKQKKRDLEAAFFQAMQQGGIASLAGGRRGKGSVSGYLAGLGAGNQMLLGAVLGAAAVYVLGDEKLRGRVMKYAIEAYTNLAGGFEEMREQAADIRAEMEFAAANPGAGDADE